MNPPPKPGDHFQISTARLATYSTVKKVNRVNLVYETMYEVGNVHQEMTLKLPLSEWANAQIHHITPA
jgi:hypothetical protein